jgi:2-C-methyl-D-erythritol 4-phosphate cytidylyltransferase
MTHCVETVLPSTPMSLAENEIVWTVVVAGGSGTRFGRPKQYEPIAGMRMLDRSVATAARAGAGVVVVVPGGDVAREAPLHAPHPVVAGGTTRSESVRAGLAAVPEAATVICVHDAARPIATEQLYRAVVAAVAAGADAAVPGLAVTDTIKVVDHAGSVTATPDRSTLRAVQTPQAFRAEQLRAAHATGGEGTDDAALVEALGAIVVVVEGEADNRKITHAADLDWARALLQSAAVAGTDGPDGAAAGNDQGEW